MAMNKDRAARVIARAQVGGGRVDSAELNIALAVHGLTRRRFDTLMTKLRGVKGNRRSPRVELVGDFAALCA